MLEQILKVDSGDRFKRLLTETESFLKYKKARGYSCCLVGCTFKADGHRKYINHLKQVHISYDKYRCQFRHSCQRQFTSIDLLIQHIRVSHSESVLPAAAVVRQAPNPDIACRCDMLACGGAQFANLKLLLTHMNTYHRNDTRQCVFENCVTWFNELSSSRHHFRLKHFQKNKIILKRKHLVEPDARVTIEDVYDDDHNANPGGDHIPGESSEQNEEECDYEHVTEDLSEEDESDDFFLRSYADFMNRMSTIKHVPYSTMQVIASEFLQQSVKSLKPREIVLRKTLKNLPGISEGKVDEIVKKVLHEDKMLNAQQELNTE